MAKKIKTARAIEANAGIQQKFKKKLLTFSRPRLLKRFCLTWPTTACLRKIGV